MSRFLEALDTDSSRASLLRAGIDAIVDLGIDNVSASDVISRAGVSRPTFYSYFDDVNGLWADIWIEVGLAWLKSLAEADTGQSEPSSAAHTALTEMLLVAPRIPELTEVVLRDVREVWSGASVEGNASLARACWNIGIALGMQASQPILPGASMLHLAITLVSGMPDDWSSSGRSRPDTRASIPRVSAPTVEETDDVVTRLLESSIDVVARSGVEKASLSRVCRAARLTTGAARPRFSSTRELVLRGFDRMIASVLDQNMAEYGTASMGTHPWDAFAAFTVSGLHPSRERWRRYRQEMHVAARVDADIAGHLSASFGEVNARLASSLLELGIDKRGVELSILLNHVLAVGFGALDAMGLPVRDVDHLAVTAWLERETGLSMK